MSKLEPIKSGFFSNTNMRSLTHHAHAEGEKALTTSTTGNASTFNLNDLKKHNVIEHDASLSRADEAQGDNWSFNSTLFDETKTYWPDATITTKQAANALEKRIDTQKAANSEFDLPLSQYTNAIGQTAMYLGVFGDYGAGNANKEYVVYFFGAYYCWWRILTSVCYRVTDLHCFGSAENEELPTSLGWSRRTDDDQITAAGIYLMIANVAIHFVGVSLGL